MNCHDAQTMLHGYLDAELDLATSLAVEEHVRDCPACTGTLAEQKALKAEMKADELYYQAPENLREQLRRSLRQPRSGRGVRSLWRWAGAAACLALCAGLGFLAAQLAYAPSKHERLIREVASSHIRSLQVDKARLVDVPSSDRHEVKPWFNDKLDFSPPVRDLAAEGFALVGGRMDYLDGRPVAALVYQRRRHIINVFLWPDSAKEDKQPAQETRQGYHFIDWAKAGMNYWVVSDLDAAELKDMVRGLQE